MRRVRTQEVGSRFWHHVTEQPHHNAADLLFAHLNVEVDLQMRSWISSEVPPMATAQKRRVWGVKAGTG